MSQMIQELFKGRRDETSIDRHPRVAKALAESQGTTSICGEV